MDIKVHINDIHGSQMAAKITGNFTLDDKEFRVLTSGTTLKRTGYIRMMRNCLIAAGNSSNRSLVPSIKKFLNSDNEIPFLYSGPPII